MIDYIYGEKKRGFLRLKARTQRIEIENKMLKVENQNLRKEVERIKMNKDKKTKVYVVEYYDGLDSGIQGVFATCALAKIEAGKIENEGNYQCNFTSWFVQGLKGK